MTELQQQSERNDEKQSRTLKTAGLSYLLGDAALFTATQMENKGGQWAALLWAAGGAGAALYGNPNPEKQLEILSRDLRDYLQKEGVAIPATVETMKLAVNDGIGARVQSFLYKHPSEVLNAAYGLGAIQLARSGMKPGGRKGDIASGILVGAGALAGLLIPEKKLEPGRKAETWKEWIQEKPLRVSGTLYTLNNAAMIHSTYEAYKSGQNSYIPRAVTAASYIFANAMLYLSSRGQTDDSKSDIAPRLADMAAHVVAAQPQHTQEALVQRISAHMAEQPGIHHKADDIANMLHTKLARLPKQQGWQATISQSDTALAR